MTDIDGESTAEGHRDEIDVMLALATGRHVREAVPTEEVSLTFQKITAEYREIRPDGTIGDVEKFAWDFAKNEPL